MQVLQIAMVFFAWFLVFEFIIYFVTSLCVSFINPLYQAYYWQS